MESSNTLDQSLKQDQIWYAGTVTKKGKINSVAQTSPRRSGFAPLFNQWECPLCAKDVAKQQRLGYCQRSRETLGRSHSLRTEVYKPVKEITHIYGTFQL